jgi:TPR repeat protein
MSNKTLTDLLRQVISDKDLEKGIDLVDNIKEWPEMDEAISFLKEQKDINGLATASFLLGDINARYKKWNEAYQYYMISAQSGINSGNYKAAQILRDHESEVGSMATVNAYDLFSVAAENGHIWSQMALLKKDANSSLLARLNWWLNRVVLLPLRLLHSMIGKSRRDDMRY